MNSITIIELAKLLELSKSTVSRALSDSHEISDATKERVRAMAKQYNYLPNPHASSLKNHKSKTIGLVLPRVDNNFFSQVINGAEEVALEKGYHILIYLTHDILDKEITILNLLQSGRVDGIIISITSETEKPQHLIEVYERGVPIVFLDRVSNAFETVRISTNDAQITAKATKHLIDNGCKRIGFLSILTEFTVGRNRLEGYKKALRDNKIPLRENLILKGTSDYALNYKAIKKLLSSPNRPDGLISPVEKMATTTYDVCRDLNIKIPSDLKIVSFCNNEVSHLFYPPLSVIVQPAFEIGKTAMTSLIQSLQKKKNKLDDEVIILPSVLKIRESSKL